MKYYCCYQEMQYDIVVDLHYCSNNNCYRVMSLESQSISACCNNIATVYRNQAWHCSECGKQISDTENLDFFEFGLPESSPAWKLKCDCGASKTSNPNCHATWCSAN